MISVKDLMPVEKSFMINQWKDTYGILVLVCVKPSIHNTTKQILRREYKVTQQKKEGASIFLFREHPLMFEHEVAHTDDCKVHLENHGKPLRSHHPMKSSNKDCLLWVESGSRALHIIWVRDHPGDDLNLWHSSIEGEIQKSRSFDQPPLLSFFCWRSCSSKSPWRCNLGHTWTTGQSRPSHPRWVLGYFSSTN